MFEWLFGKSGVDELKDETKKSFDFVKKDISAVGGWIKHLDSEKNLQKKEIDGINEDLSSIKEELEGIKNIISIMNELKNPSNLKQNKRVFNKQAAVLPVQTAVQTAVQTPNLGNFSITERAIIWILLNTDMRLGYEDIAVMMGKEKSTIRGQINTIKQKNESIIQESIEKNGKKRLFIPEEIKEKLLKKTKVRVNYEKNSRKN